MSRLALTYVFGLGMVAVFNPCGFAMLPAWIAYFVASDDGNLDRHRNVRRALAVGATLTGGFVVVFLLVGLVIQVAAAAILPRLPWLTILLGLAMVFLAIRLIRGRELRTATWRSARAPRSGSHREVFLFGVSYAFVSLACTIPLFLGAVTTSLTSGSVAVGILHFIAYACGMGVVLTVLTLAVSTARVSVVRHMRRVVPHVQRIAATLLAVAGLYVAYYGWYTMRIYAGDFDAGGPASIGYGFSSRMSAWVSSVGPIRIGLVAAGTILLAILVDHVRSAEAHPVTDEGSPPQSPGTDQDAVSRHPL